MITKIYLTPISFVFISLSSTLQLFPEIFSHLTSFCSFILLQNVEIPIVSYCKKGNFMEVDTHIHSEETANCHLKAIKEFSPFNEYSIGQKLGLFDEMGTGTQIYIWNLAKWGSDYSLEWLAGKTSDHSSYQTQGDILVRSKRIRSRPGQISQKVGYSIVVINSICMLLKCH